MQNTKNKPVDAGIMSDEEFNRLFPDNPAVYQRVSPHGISLSFVRLPKDVDFPEAHDPPGEEVPLWKIFLSRFL